MPHGLHPTPITVAPTTPDDPQAVVEAFLAAMAVGDAEVAASLVADDILYVNVSLPAIRGKAEVSKVLAMLDRPGVGFEVYLHAISASGPVVLTERTDVLIKGRFRSQFWVWGRFEVVDGKITLWRDSFDFLDITRATVRGLAAMVVPGLQPELPTTTNTQPGRPS